MVVTVINRPYIEILPFKWLQDVRAQNVPTHRFFFFKLATQKKDDLLLPKRQKDGGY